MRIIHRGMAIALASLSLAGSALAAPVENAPVENVLYSFTGGADGGNPFAGLIADWPSDIRDHVVRLAYSDSGG